MNTSFHILLVVTGNQYSEPPSSAIKFPIAADLVNYTKNIKEVSEINIPPSLVQERMEEMDDNGELTVLELHIFVIVIPKCSGNSIILKVTIHKCIVHMFYNIIAK